VLSCLCPIFVKKYLELLWLPVVSLQSYLCAIHVVADVSAIQPPTPLIITYYPVKDNKQLKLLNMPIDDIYKCTYLAVL